MELLIALGILALLFLVFLVGAFLLFRDMLDRLMAKNLTDLKANTAPAEPNQLVDAEADHTIPLEDAEEEILKEDDGEE